MILSFPSLRSFPDSCLEGIWLQSPAPEQRNGSRFCPVFSLMPESAIVPGVPQSRRPDVGENFRLLSG